ncbi:LytR C-terminal domain-containing protein [Gordonia sp. ABSL1-1]|uniref:LytR C-terminal domain-containing protein n=1 Tax=Gordonia sp. ABSL1-1 TaxID=3053923 RepID=UPI0025727E39|nr:LytR C-terminal domain-containing protein [Gordonia sp. ABSL1-1]MDL9936997.1 LytR C-terminal domain-containing protein [Gordonia sp. ABSL1-1]
MNADREPNRLPFRAGAMLLFAVAVVFIGLGWHSAVTSGDDEDSAPAAGPATVTTPVAPPTSTVEASTKSVCVINAGEVEGLAGKVTAELKQQGYKTRKARNYSGGGFSENTIFYDDAATKAQADKVNAALGGTYTLEERPSTFASICADGIPVIAYTDAETPSGGQ